MKIRHRKNMLFPFAVFALRDFKIDTGHETPKQITIMASRIDAFIINIPPIYLFVNKSN